MSRAVDKAGQDQPVPAARSAGRLGSPTALHLISTGAKLLFANGQTTERTVAASKQLADKLGLRVSVFPSWGELTLRTDGEAGSLCEITAAQPVGVDMRKVASTMGVIGQVCDGKMEAWAARTAFEEIAGFPPVPIARFALLAAAGAAALGVIFGAAHLLSLVVMGLSAGAGACLRRWLSSRSGNLFLQPFCAAFLAGAIGAGVARLQLGSALRLIAVCPCMVLVPGPHILNGAIDLARARITLGVARMVYANLIILMICAGLLLGLGLSGENLPASGPSHAAPLGYDVLAAGVAVAAYGTFFAMPWRMLPIPVLIGMLAHASRWLAISKAGASPALGALLACLVVGILATPIADHLRLPFAGLAFASVVSLIPGVFLFRMAGGMADFVALGPRAPHELFIQVADDGTTAILIILAMTVGLLLPKMCIEHLRHFRPTTRSTHI